MYPVKAHIIPLYRSAAHEAVLSAHRWNIRSPYADASKIYSGRPPGSQQALTLVVLAWICRRHLAHLARLVIRKCIEAQQSTFA